MKKRIFSGAQPTGELHIGNYLGALKNWVKLQDEYDAFYCIVNLHAITVPQDPKVLRQKTLDLARIYLAAGVDPEKSTIFIQSEVAEHAELAWILNCVARMGELERMTQFKEKSRNVPHVSAETIGNDHFSGTLMEKFKEFTIEILKLANPNTEETNAIAKPLLEFVSLGQSYSRIGKALLGLEQTSKSGVGLFGYPVLMASDILLYQTDLVPVGKDQKQHLELTRDLAERFNRDFGETFVVPDPYIPPVGAKILSLKDPSKKMSKSDENLNASIFLLDDADTITRKIKKAVTDSGTEITFNEERPAINNLLTIYQLMSGKTSEECEANFAGKGYGDFKRELAEVVVEYMKPFQEKVNQYDDADLSDILKEGAEKAREVARATLKDVYQKMGIG